MKRNNEYELRSICGAYMLISSGEKEMDFSKLIKLNESSAFIWNVMGESEFTLESLKKRLTEEYDVDDVTAQKDLEDLLATLISVGAVNQ